MSQIGSITLLCLALYPGALAGQTAKSSPIDETINKILLQEKQLVERLQKLQPIAETYIQHVRTGSEGTPSVTSDVYFIGRMDLSNGVQFSSFSPERTRSAWTSLFSFASSFRFLPRGFVQMAVIDNSGFDRRHYALTYVRREFLGEVRCLVFDVSPAEKSGEGRFVGRIWVEDIDFHIVRFSGTYSSKSKVSPYVHFNSWRTQSGAGEWLPSFIYVEELDPNVEMFRNRNFKGQVRIWGYKPRKTEREDELTSILVESANAKDRSEKRDLSQVEGLRIWQRQAEANIVERLEQAGLLAPKGELDKILETVVSNLLVTNNITFEPGVNCRVLLTSPVESFTVGYTIVLSRGLIDSLPDEASLAMVLAAELSHVLLGHQLDTKFAFNDRTLVEDSKIFQTFNFRRTNQEREEADRKAIELLKKSPYKDKIPAAGLYLRAVGDRIPVMPNLFQPRFGNPLAENGLAVRMASLMTNAPVLDMTDLTQIAAMPLGSRVRLDPWSNQVELVKAATPVLLSEREKMPFEVTPFMLALTRQPHAGGARGSTGADK